MEENLILIFAVMVIFFWIVMMRSGEKSDPISSLMASLFVSTALIYGGKWAYEKIQSLAAEKQNAPASKPQIETGKSEQTSKDSGNSQNAPCDVCRGTGYIITEVSCTNCSGNGKINNDKQCYRCSGSGTIFVTCTLCDGKRGETCGAVIYYSNSSTVYARCVRGVIGGKTCNNCGGDGWKECGRCNGRGEMKEMCPICRGSGTVFGQISCPQCSGKGRIEKREYCRKCNGTGMLKK